MGSSRESKAASHERIVEIASQRIRESGTETPGVAEIMSAAGLTHGGFYKHFSSRDELIAEALDRALADTESAMSSVMGGADDPLAAFVDSYLSEEHRDQPATGCGVAALAGDVTRGDDRLRSAYRHQVELYLAHVQEMLGGEAESRRSATLAVSSLVGALVLARAVDDEALSAEILGDVRDAVKAMRLET
jgi:TetR/AcrR family transcriptional repressor of nem operon